MRLLPFQKAVQNDLINNKSCLVVLSKGLGVYNVIYNFLTTLNIGNNCIFLLNLSVPETIYFKIFVSEMDQINSKTNTDKSEFVFRISEKIEIVNSEMNLQKRIIFYNKGGIYIVSSRILLTDILSEHLNLKSVNGIIVFNAETLNVKNWNDAFILQLFKSENPQGFIKGISQRPENLIHGYFGPGIAMKYIGTTNLCLYSRNNFLVEESFRHSQKIKVTEKAVKATDYFYNIQKCITLLMEKGLNEILKLDSAQEISMSDLLYSPTKKLQFKIESINQDLWNKMAPKLRRVIKEIIFLRNLLDMLYLLDAATFFFCIEFIRSSNLIDSSWILTPEFETLFKSSRYRVFRISNQKNLLSKGKFEYSLFNLSLEANPVLIQLLDILLNVGDDLSEKQLTMLNKDNTNSNFNDKLFLNKPDFIQKINFDENVDILENGKDFNEDEIELEAFEKNQLYERCPLLDTKIIKYSQKNFTELPQYRILIVLPDDFCQNADEMEYLILNGPQNFVIKRFVELSQNLQIDSFSCISHIIQRLISSSGFPIDATINNKSHSLNQLKIIISKLLQQQSNVNYSHSCKDVFVNFLPESIEFESLNGHLEGTKKNKIKPQIVITNTRMNIQGKFWNLLSSFIPHLVITLDPEISIIREIELFAALTDKNNEFCLELIVITIQNSIRHERYLQTIKSEEGSWANLERHKKTLVVPLNDITESEIITKLARSFPKEIRKVPSDENFQRIIVDTREFRSSLPYQLFCKGIRIIPLTLAVGDYVISRDVCIERKSIRDLIASLNNGRLYTQVQWLTKHYTIPVILIELNNATESLNNQGKQQSFVPPLQNSFDTYNKLVLLIRHFPNLKIIWSNNTSFSSCVILHIKSGRQQPDINFASISDTNILTQNNNFIEEKNNEAKNKRKRTLSDSSKSSYYALTFLRQLPGVNTKNIKVLTSKFNSIKEIANASVENLIEYLGVSNGTTLFRAINENFIEKYAFNEE